MKNNGISMDSSGTYEEKFSHGRELVQRLHESGREVVSPCSVYQDGKTLIDIWSGYSDKEKNIVWNRDTLANVW